MDVAQVARRVSELAEPLAIRDGLEVVAVEYHPEGGRMVLRVYLDREGGVTLDDLTRLSRELGDLLDVHADIGSPYTLEVSSPGINRPLTREEHFRRFVGRRVRVRTASAVEGRRNFIGRLDAVSASGVVLDLGDGRTVAIPFTAIRRANYEHEFTRPGARDRRQGTAAPAAPRGVSHAT